MALRGLVLNTNQIELENSEFEFFLTGSRFFGGSTDNSDYDFYCQDTKEVREWLKNHGYTSRGSYDDLAKYRDTNIALVYAKDDIHVQCQRDIEMKHKAQAIMFLFRSCWQQGIRKDPPKRMHWWNAVYKMLSSDPFK